MDVPYQIKSRLMQLPVDIISLLQAHLSPASQIAFSLACRGLYEKYFASARKARASASNSEKRDTIFLLEKDVSHRQFFCPFCRCFRGFGTGWGEGLCSFERYHNIDPEDPDSRRLAIRDCQGPEITFPLGRLVMNRHFFGEDRGLPLSCLEVTDLPVKALGGGKNALMWKETRQARIIGDELYLRCTHVLDQEEQGAIHARDLRDRLRTRSWYNFCKHQATGRLSRNPIFVGRTRYASEARSPFTAHDEIGFGCALCLTDCTTSVERRQRIEVVGADGTAHEDGGSWVFRVDTYRRLGSFRRAYDLSFVLACDISPWYPRCELADSDSDSERRRIDENDFRFGLIWRRWHGPEAPQGPPGGWLPDGYTESHQVTPMSKSVARGT